MPSKIRKRGIDSYELTVSSGYENGKQALFRKTVQAANVTEAKKLYKQFESDVIEGRILAAGTEKMTLSEFYIYWKHHYADEHLEVTTRALDDHIFERIKAALGSIRIDKITPRQILKFIDQLKKPDASSKNKPLSQAYIRKHVSLLKTMLTHAYQWEFILNNPCDKVRLPREGRSSKKIPTESELKQFLAALSEHKILKHRLWVMLAFAKGLRREEIFGLKWQDIDFDKRTLTVARAAVYVAGYGINEKDCKTDNSYRTLSVPQDILSMLSAWKDEIKEASKRRAKRNKVVPIEDPTASDKWLFPQLDGSVGHPHAFNNFLKRFCADHNLPAIGPHVFRHLSGSYLLNAGVDLAAVSAELGHGDKSFTLKTYIHELKSAQEHSANVMQGILENLKTETTKRQAK